MISRETFIESVRSEVTKIKHLYTKVPKANLQYRPSEKQRSLAELLAYIPTTVAAMPFFISGDMAALGPAAAKIEADAKADFIGTLDREVNKFITLVQSFKESDFATKECTFFTGEKMMLGTMLLNFGLKFLTGYRMQLFLYLKAGQPELTTWNCWLGQDAPPKK